MWQLLRRLVCLFFGHDTRWIREFDEKQMEVNTSFYCGRCGKALIGPLG